MMTGIIRTIAAESWLLQIGIPTTESPPFDHFGVQLRALAKSVAVKTDRRDWQKATGNMATWPASGLTNKAVSRPGNSLFPGRLLRAHKIQINDKTSRTTTRRTSLPATFAFHCQNANLASRSWRMLLRCCPGFLWLIDIVSRCLRRIILLSRLVAFNWGKPTPSSKLQTSNSQLQTQSFSSCFPKEKEKKINWYIKAFEF